MASRMSNKLHTVPRHATYHKLCSNRLPGRDSALQGCTHHWLEHSHFTDRIRPDGFLHGSKTAGKNARKYCTIFKNEHASRFCRKAIESYPATSNPIAFSLLHANPTILYAPQLFEFPAMKTVTFNWQTMTNFQSKFPTTFEIPTYYIRYSTTSRLFSTPPTTTS